MSYENKGSMATGLVISHDPDRSGNYICNGVADEVQFNNAIADLPSSGGMISVKHGTYVIEDPIVSGAKAIALRGLGGTGRTSVPSNDPVVELRAGAGLTDFILKLGVNNNSTMGYAVKNIVFNGLQRTSCLGGIDLRNSWHGIFESLDFNDFYRTTEGSEGTAIYIHGDASPADGSYYNSFRTNHMRQCTYGYHFRGYYANANTILGGVVSCSRNISSIGIYLDVNCGSNKIYDIDVATNRNANQIGVKLENSSDYNHFFGLRMENNYANINIANGANYNHFFGGACGNIDPLGLGGGYFLVDNGAANEFYGWSTYVTVNGGANTIGDGGTINHGLGVNTPGGAKATPLWVVATPSVAGNMASVTAKNVTNFTVALKTHTGAAAGSQTVYWRAGLY